MEKQGKIALVLGATGLVGGELVEQLLNSPYYREVVAFVRRPFERKHAKLRQEVLDFDQPDAAKIRGDDLFCALGTTLSKAGSKDVQYRIDCLYPAQIGLLARQNGVRQYLLVSALGAKADSSNFYLRTKGDLEEKIKGLQFENFVTARPSLLLGERTEFRLAEKIGSGFARLFAPVIPRKYRGIEGSKVAAALIALANQVLRGFRALESDELQEY
ncbi:MAG: NAD(P)H-binding protein [Saprospiraceae bacterium]